MKPVLVEYVVHDICILVRVRNLVVVVLLLFSNTEDVPYLIELIIELKRLFSHIPRKNLRLHSRAYLKHCYQIDFKVSV